MQRHFNVQDMKNHFFLSFLCHQLTSVLREVKYLSMMKNPKIPKAALHLYSKQERLYVVRQWDGLLLFLQIFSSQTDY